jgi:hypothetical protein
MSISTFGPADIRAAKSHVCFPRKRMLALHKLMSAKGHKRTSITALALQLAAGKSHPKLASPVHKAASSH